MAIIVVTMSASDPPYSRGKGSPWIPMVAHLSQRARERLVALPLGQPVVELVAGELDDLGLERELLGGEREVQGRG